MEQKNITVTKTTVLFALETILPRAIAFFLVPLYTYNLTTEEFGTSDLILTTVQLLIPFSTILMHEALMCFIIKNEHQTRSITSSAFFISTTATAVLCCITLLLLFTSIEREYIFYLIVLLILSNYQALLIGYCKGCDELTTMLIGSIINTITMLLLSIVLISVYKLGIAGYLFANIGSLLASNIFLFLKSSVHKQFTVKIPKQLAVDMLKYGWPLIFSSLSWWINNASDRYIIAGMCGVAVSGIYTVACKIPNILSALQGIIGQTWAITATREGDDANHNIFVQEMFNGVCFIMALACSCILLFNIPLAKLLFEKEFFVAWKYVPFLLVSVVINTDGDFLGRLLLVEQKSKLFSITTILGAVVNTVFNFILIYFFGPIGAAVATLLGFLATYIIRCFIIKKQLPLLNIKKTKMIVTTILLCSQATLATFEKRHLACQIVLSLLILLICNKELLNILKSIRTLIKNVIERKKT